MSLKIKELPESERPYEKLKMYGAKKLSNTELLAIIIKTGTKNATSLELSNRILLLIQNLSDLESISIEKLKSIKGIGEVKAIQIKAICELASRMNKPVNRINRVMKSTKDVANLFMDELRYQKYEYLKVLFINSKNELIKILDLKMGTTNEILVTPAQILAEIVKEQVPKFIIIHNHPSGDPKPSRYDKEFTQKLKICSELLGVIFLDHIIIGNGVYRSIFKERKE